MAFRFSTKLFNAFLSTLQTQMAKGEIQFYSGPQPPSPDSAPTGTLIGVVTVNGGVWAAGNAANGLSFGTPTSAVLNKASGETWTFTCSTPGTIGWGRFIANTTAGSGSLGAGSPDVGAADSPATATFPRMDFSVGITTGDCLMTKVTYAAAETGVIQTFSIPFTNIS